jgi:hypothetical protein
MKSMTMSALLAALLAGTVAMPAAAAEGEGDMNAGQNVQQNRSQWSGTQGDSTRGEVRPSQRDARTVRQEQTAVPANGENTAVQVDARSNAGQPRQFNRGSNQYSRSGRDQRDSNGQRRFGYRGSDRHFADRGQGDEFGRHGADPRAGYRGSDHRFAYRGQGHAFGRYGNDRRFWARGANHRFGSHAGQPRFGNQWGHPSQGRASSRINRMQAQQHRQIVQGIRSGELTQHEARRLRGEQRMIRNKERTYLADGHLNRAERHDLSRDLRSANRQIYNQRHDRQTRR